MKRFAFLIVLFTLTLLPGVAFAYDSGICTGNSTCTAQEVGVFMEGISLECGNTGDCTLEDIMLLFTNTGNYVVGIIGGIVLLMYVIGGFYFLASAGRTEWVAKGKKYLTISTTGLLIVMFAYIGIYSIRGTLISGNAYVAVEYVTCTDLGTAGLTCDQYSTCVNGLCLSLCQQQYDDAEVRPTSANSNTWSRYECFDTNISSNPFFITPTSCIPNLCPGPAETQCCLLETQLGPN